MTGHDIPSDSIRLTTPKDSRTGDPSVRIIRKYIAKHANAENQCVYNADFYAIIRNSVYACARFASDSVHSAARIDKQMFNY